MRLSDEDKEKVARLLRAGSSSLGDAPRSAAKERAEVRRQRMKMGRPKIGKGVKVISLSVEQGLLKRADAYAKRHGLKRAEMVARGLSLVMTQAAKAG